MKIAILDLGTNTFNIFIAEIFPNQSFLKLYKSKISVKLGEGGINQNLIEENSFNRGIKALKKHKKTSESFGVEKIVAFATSGIRSASNGNDFVRVAKEKTGVDIEVISGSREAELIYYGVRSAVQLKDTPSLIIDIGGGSTEFILANKRDILWKQSFLLGAARLLEKFKPSDPISREEINQIEKHLEENLQPLFSAIAPLSTDIHSGTVELVGSSGSFDSLAEMIGYRYYNAEVLKGKLEYDLNLEDFKKLHQVILRSTLKERFHMKGLTKMRVDMIVVSSIFVNFILLRLGIQKMRVSKYSLKEGVLAELIHS